MKKTLLLFLFLSFCIPVSGHAMAIFNGQSFTLKYLFGCEFDNQTYIQTSADVSLTNSDKSAFFDVKDKPIKRFWLTGEGHKYLVDLTDGHFEVDNVPFKIHQESLKDFKLIYYRQHRVMTNTDNEQIGHDIEYHFGWVAKTSNDKEVQRIMVIK